MAPILYDWKILDFGIYYAISGKTRHHPEFEDGTMINTSPLREINFVDGFAVTNNSEYILI